MSPKIIVGIIITILIVSLIVYLIYSSPSDPVDKTFTLNNAQTNSGSAPFELGKIGVDGKLTSFELKLLAKDQGWGNACSWYNLEIHRSGKAIYTLYNGTAPRAEATNKVTKNVSSRKYIVKKDDAVVMMLSSPYPNCQTILNNIEVKLTVGPADE